MQNTNNNLKYYISAVSSNCALNLITGSVVQTFLLEYGVSPENVTFYVSSMQIVQTLTMLLISRWIENIRSIIKANAISIGMQFLLAAVLAFFCHANSIDAGIMYKVVFAASIIVNIFYGAYSVVAYKLPYHIMDIKDYGRVTSFSGIFIGISGALFSAYLAYATARYEYFASMTLFFAAGASLFLLSFAIGMRYKKVDFKEETHEKTNLLKYKPFYLLIIPNLLRGFANGVVTVAAVIGSYFKIIDASGGGTLLFLYQAATILGCFIYSFFSKKNKDAQVLLISGICFVILLPLLIAGKSKPVFFTVYFLLNIVWNFVNYGVPVAVTKMVDYRYIGQYSAWRMLLHTLGTAIGGGCMTFMLGAFGGTATLIFAGLCQFLSSVKYYICIKKYPINRE